MKCNLYPTSQYWSTDTVAYYRKPTASIEMKINFQRFLQLNQDKFANKIYLVVLLQLLIFKDFQFCMHYINTGITTCVFTFSAANLSKST